MHPGDMDASICEWHDLLAITGEATMRLFCCTIAALAFSQPVSANDWEKFYRPLPWATATVPSTAAEPQVVPSSGDADQDVEAMWRNGFAPIGVSNFNSPNSKTSDAIRFGRKLKAAYVMLNTRLESSRTSAIPWTSPTTSTSITSGSATVQGPGGFGTGTYSGTTTTQGSQTTYIPITVNRFEKIAVYFGAAPKVGLGVLTRDLNQEEVTRLETRRAIAVRFIRDGSPAYVSDILPGDIITHIDGKVFDSSALEAAFAANKPFRVTVVRKDASKELTVSIPSGWGSSANP